MRDNPIVASAVDHSPSTVSPPASPAKTSGENAPAKPRMNAVACEVQVIATGARPAEEGGKRELFTEETTTALVFENGGVLRLAAAVAPGQLLFLTHKESKREVVAQVTRKRDFRPTVCYVEVEFSEASPGFWGVKFPEVPAAAPVAAATAAVPAPQRNVEQPERAEQPELAQHAGPVEEDFIGDEPATPTVAPSAHEVAALKTEVEALREQLKLLQTQTAASVMSTEPSQVPVDTAAQGPVPVNAPAPPLPKLRLNTRDEAHGPVTEVSGAAGGEGTVAPPAAAEAASEPNEPSFSEEDLLPKPALNFDTAKPARKGSSKPKSKAEPGQIVAAKGSSSAVRKDLLFAAFVVVTLGAVWYENLLPWLPRPKFFGPSAAPMVTARPAPRAPAKTTAVQADEPKIAKASEAPAAAASAPSTAQNETTRAGNDAKYGAAQPAALEAAKASTPAAAETAGVGNAKTVSEAAADAAATPERSMK